MHWFLIPLAMTLELQRRWFVALQSRPTARIEFAVDGNVYTVNFGAKR